MIRCMFIPQVQRNNDSLLIRPDIQNQNNAIIMYTLSHVMFLK